MSMGIDTVAYIMIIGYGIAYPLYLVYEGMKVRKNNEIQRRIFENTYRNEGVQPQQYRNDELQPVLNHIDMKQTLNSKHGKKGVISTQLTEAQIRENNIKATMESTYLSPERKLEIIRKYMGELK